MEFIFDNEHPVVEIKLEQLDGKATVLVERMMFKSPTSKYVENALKNGKVVHNEQDVIVDEIRIKKKEYNKFQENIRYSMSGIGLTQHEKEVYGYKIFLGNVSFHLSNRPCEQGDEIVFEDVSMTMWPYKEYYSKKIDN